MVVRNNCGIKARRHAPENKIMCDLHHDFKPCAEPCGIYRTVSNKCTCLNTPPTFEFCQPYFRNHLADLNQIFRAYS